MRALARPLDSISIIGRVEAGGLAGFRSGAIADQGRAFFSTTGNALGLDGRGLGVAAFRPPP